MDFNGWECNKFGILCVQGRAKWMEMQMSSFLEQLLFHPFGALPK